MFDFTFHNPTKILFGRGREQQIGRELREAGSTRVLLVYGQNSIKASGLYETICASLATHRIDRVDCGGVSPNPRLDHTRRAIELARAEQVQAILAVGGGSVLDEAKAIAVGVTGESDIWDYFTGLEVRKALPVFTVLTLAATGSEMNGNSVITNEATGQKYSISSPHIHPQVSILNPELTMSVPADHSAYGAVDAIAHVIEAYFTKQEEARLQERLVESIIRTVIETTETIMARPDDYQARAQFMWAATLALNGLTVAGTKGYGFPNHMIEHALSGLYDIPHGAGLAIVMPAWMRWYHKRCPKRFERFAQQIFGLPDGLAGIAALEEWFTTIKAPTRLDQVKIPANDLEKIAANAHDLAHHWGLATDYPESAIVEVLQLAL